VDKSQGDPARLTARLGELFRAMQTGGDFALEDIQWFNGGLFADPQALTLDRADIDVLLRVSRLDWSAIDPSIFGTLFERGLDPSKRSQLGAHYTDPATILRLVDATVVQPLTFEWNAAKDEIAARLGKSKKHGDKAFRAAEARFAQWQERLRNVRVLDPACGSGNFLYLALKALKDIEHRANLEAEALGLQRPLLLQTSPANVMGIELNPYAAELARLTVWIGELQWLAHGYEIVRNPILRPLDHIECRDAVMNEDGTEAQWPGCDVIVGNPPFLGAKWMRNELGDAYTDRLRSLYRDRVPGEADLVMYWFEKARSHLAAGAPPPATEVSSDRRPGSTSCPWR
jgi:type II restriction/modification system DNA methylase subunit YeeA